MRPLKNRARGEMDAIEVVCKEYHNSLRQDSEVTFRYISPGGKSEGVQITGTVDKCKGKHSVIELKSFDPKNQTYVSLVDKLISRTLAIDPAKTIVRRGKSWKTNWMCLCQYLRDNQSYQNMLVLTYFERLTLTIYCNLSRILYSDSSRVIQYPPAFYHCFSVKDAQAKVCKCSNINREQFKWLLQFVRQHGKVFIKKSWCYRISGN